MRFEGASLYSLPPRPMKKIILCLISLLAFHSGNSQMRAKTDERFELTSILFALAGAPEYCMCPIPSYFQDIVDELAPFDRSAPVEYARELHQIHRIGYDAVATTAAMLEIEDGVIRLRPEYDASGIADLDSRWNEELLRKYIRMLNEFYVLSNFHTFYEEHRPLYEAAEKRMDRVLEQIDCGRFESLFGVPLDPEEMSVYVSLTNGPSNYSVPGGVLIGMSVDREGVPDTAPGTDFLLVHEMAHHYTNPILDRFEGRMRQAADAIYPHVAEQMACNAYGSAEVMIGEWFNNLCTLLSLWEPDTKEMEEQSDNLVRRGFLWMPRSIACMKEFYARRDRYPRIEDFMPQLIAFLDHTAEHFEEVLLEYEKSLPRIVSVFPAVGSDISGCTEIVITFSETMNGSYGFSGTGSDDPNVRPLFLIDDFEKAVVWSPDRRQATLKLDPSKARKNTTYGIQLHTRGFQSARHYSLNDAGKNLLFHTGR